jgi:DNA-binding response OmpR family regulator
MVPAFCSEVNGMNVLVHGNPLLAYRLALALREDGHTVIRAASESEMLEMIKTSTEIDLVALDEKAGGRKTLHSLRKNGTVSLAVILVLGTTSTSAKVRKTGRTVFIPLRCFRSDFLNEVRVLKQS